jgi:hypothetical protein
MYPDSAYRFYVVNGNKILYFTGHKGNFITFYEILKCTLFVFYSTWNFRSRGEYNSTNYLTYDKPSPEDLRWSV